MFTKESSERAAKDFKIVFNEAIAFAEEKQETLALKLGVTQAQISNYCNPYSDRNFPMGLFMLLPSRMKQFLLKYFGALAAGVETTQKDLNGSIDDEIITMVQLEADLKRQSETDPKKAMKTIQKLREVIERSEREIELIQKNKDEGTKQ